MQIALGKVNATFRRRGSLEALRPMEQGKPQPRFVNRLP